MALPTRKPPVFGFCSRDKNCCGEKSPVRLVTETFSMIRLTCDPDTGKGSVTMLRKRYKKQINEVRREPDDLKRKLKLLALLTEILEPEGFAPVLVGGTALEFYTFGGYATADVDIVVPSKERVAEVLAEIGFSLEGRHWYSEEMDVAVEIPDNTLTGSLEKTVSVSIGGRKIRIIGPEDLIVDRLSAAKFWKVQSDLDWAVSLLLLHRDKIDRQYLEKAAVQEGVGDILAQAFRKSERLLQKQMSAPQSRPFPQEEKGGPKA
jgi:predicted nucleotidyltransferase